MFRQALLSCVVILITASVAMAWDYTVDSTEDLPDTNPGDLICEASNGLCTLRAAVEELNQHGAVLIDFASPNMTITLDSSLQLFDDVIIKGFSDESTIIQTSGLFTAFDLVGTSLTLRDLTVRYASPAVKVSLDGEIVVMNCDLIDNGSPAWPDGTITASPGSVTLIDSTIRNSASSWNGGAVNVYSPLAGTGLTVSGCSFTSNYAGGDGGAIYFVAGDVLVIEDTVFDGNSAVGRGGALAIDTDIGSTAVGIHGCDILNNSAVSGGAIAVFSDNIATEDRDLEIDGTNIGFNSASGSGGAVFLDTDGTSTILIRNSSVYANEAALDGGGLKSAGTEIVEIVNSTFSLNDAGADGGGLHLSSGLTGALVYSSTITLNTADSLAAENNGSGGGIFVENGAGLVYFRNTILADNDDLSTAPTAFYGPDCYADIASEGHNLIGYSNFWCDLSGGPGDLVGDGTNGAIDPVLGTLMMNTGWPTFAHPLLDGSPAIDTADPAGCTDVDGSPLDRDQVGRPRPVGVRSDIGAYELGPPVHIFSEGFESGGTWYWSDVVGE